MQIFVIKKIRESKNITLYKLSKETGISRTYLRDLENNTKFNPTLLMLEKISDALNVKLKDLFYSPNEIENLRKEMYERIDKFGINSKETMEISQIIDLLVNIKMRKKD